MIGLIGGSGVGLSIIGGGKGHDVSTPYGRPSMPIVEGTVNGQKVLGILRHGPAHALTPSQVNYRANVWALKELGASMIITVHAVGSLQEEYKPGELVFVDQFIDRTTKRHTTFFDRGKVMHISMADPYCPSLRSSFSFAAKKLGIPHHPKGTAIVMEGPRFSTRAESSLYRSWGADIISMTLLPESVLSRELGLHCAAIGMVTDYDCWKDSIVDMDTVNKTVQKNAEKLRILLDEIVPNLAPTGCSCETDFTKAFA